MNSTIKHTLFQQFFQKKYEKPKKRFIPSGIEPTPGKLKSIHSHCALLTALATPLINDLPF